MKRIPLGPILLVFVAVAVRVAYVSTLDRQKLTWLDEIAYDRIAWHLAQTGQFVSGAYEATPVLPAFLAGVYSIFGHDYRAARFCQAILGGVLVLAMFGIGVTFFDRKTAYLAGVGTAFYPQFIYLSGVFYAEHMFAVLMAVTVVCFARWQAQQPRSWLVAAGLMMGLTALCRPVFLAFFPFALLYVWWRARKGGKWRPSAAVAVVALLTISPWTLRNAAVFGRFVPISTGMGLHLWRGNNELSLGDADDRHLNLMDSLWIERAQTLLSETQRAELTSRTAKLVNEMESLDEVSGDRRLAAEGFRWLREHPRRFICESASRLLTLYSAFSKTITKAEVVSRRNALIAAVGFYPVLILGTIGMFLAVRRNHASLIVHGAILANLLVYVPMTACTRFRVPIDGYWILFAALTVTTATGKASGNAWRSVKPSEVVSSGLTSG